MPRCKTALGCPIEELASNRQIYAACIDFLKARSLLERTGVQDRLVEFYQRIESDLETESELEQIWIEYKQQQANEPKGSDHGWKKTKRYRRT